MNERIDELMIQAGARFEFLHGVHYDDFQYRKFAELLEKEFEAKHFSAGYIQGHSDGIKETARECMKLNRDILCEDDLDYLDKVYKDHFGVGE